jgi:hypothetical protein
VALNVRLNVRRRVAAVLAAAATAAGMVATVGTPGAHAEGPTAPDHLVIAAVWGANSDTARWTNDWIELFNPTDHDIALGTVSGGAVTSSDYSLCYRGVTTSPQKCSTTVKLSGTVRPHHYFFVWYANAHSPADVGTYPSGLTPDLDVSVKTAANGQQQGSNMGGCTTGGQVLLLSSSASSAANAPTLTGDLSSADAKTDGVVDAVGWTHYQTDADAKYPTSGYAAGYTQPNAAEANGNAVVTGLNAGTTNGCVIARSFTDGVPVDTDTNRTDFSSVVPADFTVHSQLSDHVAVAAVSDTEISRNQPMTPIQLQASKGVGALSYAADGLPDGVSIDPGTGIISGTPAATDDLKDYPVTVTVSDSTPGSPDTVTTSFTLTVSNTLRVVAPDTVSVRKGAAMEPVRVNARGGTPEYHYAATGLPNGVTIDPDTGVVSGTPTDAVSHYDVQVTVTDSGVGAAAQSVSADFTLIERPKSTSPAPTDPLAGLKINEVKATGTPASDWVELVNTSAAIADASVSLVDGDGDSYRVPTQDIGAGNYVVIDGADLGAAGVELAASGTLDLTDADDTVLDETSWTTYPGTSWARYPDGTGDFTVAKKATRGTENSIPAAVTTDHLVISEVNGDQSGVYDNNWVELYNPTDSPIQLGALDASTDPATVTPNYFLCYSATANQSCSVSYQMYGTIYPHHHFLVATYDAASATLPSLPSGVMPDIDFGSTDPAVNPSRQKAENMGGYSTGGQWLLLDGSVDTTGIYPTAANDTSANDAHFGDVGHVTWSPTGSDFDLADPSINPSPVVDAMGFSKSDGTNNVHGAEGWTGTAVCAADGSNTASCVHSAPVLDASHWDERIFRHGMPQDTNDNAADFAISQRDPISASSEHVVIAPVDDAEISVGEQIAPIAVKAQAIFGDLDFTATGLPGGLTLDQHTGLITGAADASDELKAYPVTVTVSDGVASDTRTTSFTLTLSKDLRLEPIADVSAHKGTALTDLQVTGHGGMPPYTYSATGLPEGVTIDPSTGALSGTPTDEVGHYAVRVTVSDSATGADHASVSHDFTFIELPALGGPAPSDPLAGLTLNEVKATGTPANDWVELYNSGADLAGASIALADSKGDLYPVPARDIPAGGYVVVTGSDLHAAGLDLDAADTLFLIESDGTLLDQTSWSSFAPTTWARDTDGTGTFEVSGWPTKGTKNSGAPAIAPNDLLVSEVNYDNNSTDYYEYSEITNTTDHPIDFAAYGLTVTKSGAAMTFHDSSTTTQASPVVDPVIPAHGTQVFWWVENQYFGVKTTAQFRSNYGLASTTPVVLVFGFSSMANSGGDHSYYISVDKDDSTPISRAYVDTPCAANTLNGTAACTATNGNYAEHYAVPADRTDPDAAVWYNSLHAKGDDINYTLKAALSSPGTVDLEQLGFSRSMKITSATSDAVTLHNTAKTAVDLSGYVLQKNKAGATYTLASGTTVAAGDDLVVDAGDSGLRLGARDYITLLAPSGYAYADGYGIVDTTGPFLHKLAYDASSGEAPVIDETTGLPLPPAGGLYRPAGVSAHNGTIYVSNTGDNVVSALTDAGNTIIAGTLEGHGDNGDEGPAVNPDDSSKNATLYQPGGTAQDAKGDIFIADSGDNVIREITPDGIIHRFAGTGIAGGVGAQLTPTSTPTTVNLWHPNGVAVDSLGNVFISDTNDNRILKVTAAGTISAVAGTGKAGYGGDGAPATTAMLALPTGIAVDAQDNLYIADSSNNVIRRVEAGTGVITTVAGNYAADQTNNGCLGAFTGDGGPATSAQLNDPLGVALDGAGDLFIADAFNNAIREVTPDGIITTLVNTSGVAGAENTGIGGGAFPEGTHLNTPSAVAVDSVTNALYIADTKNNAVAEVLNAAYSGQASGPVESAEALAISSSPTAPTACAVLRNGPVLSEVAPRIIGTHAVGSTLTANTGTWSPKPDSFAYQWLRDGVMITGATKATYRVTAADGGHLLSVAVTVTKAEYASTSATSDAVSIPKPTKPVVKPTPVVKPNVKLQHALAKLAHDRAVLAKAKKAKHKALKALHRKHLTHAAAAKKHKSVARLTKKIKRLHKAIKADQRAVKAAR